MTSRAALIVVAGIMITTALKARPLEPPGAEPWPSYQIIMWHTKTARQNAALRALGVTAAKVETNRNGETPADAQENALPVVSAGLGIYIENIATDFYSAYHRWASHRPENWKFLELKKALNQNLADESVFVRDPGLSDQFQLARIETRLTAAAQNYAPYRPIFFSLGDETGIADLSAAWDFDFSLTSLSAMRVWLSERYGTLGALNQEWSTQFRRWEDVVPLTTTQAMARSDDNYAPWSDFKDWMDVAFARSISDGTKAVHAGASWARAGIEGVQRPGWGGYNYSLLAPSVDVMEIYDDGSNLELAQAFNPNIVVLASPNWSKPNAQHVAWSQFLRGSRGMVLWDPRDEFVAPDGKPGIQARATSAFIANMRSGMGPLLIASRRHFDRIAILYSPASFRIQWMLNNRALGQDWTERSAGTENEENDERAARRRALGLLSQLGFAPVFVSDEQVARGLLRTAGFRMLVLPQTLALSKEAAVSIRDFVHGGGVVAADGGVGLFDGHGKRLRQPQLSDLLVSANEQVVRLSQVESVASSQLAGLLKKGGLVAEVTIKNAAGESVSGVKQYLFDGAGVRFVALLSDPSAEDVEQKATIDFEPRDGGLVYDARSGALLGKSPRVSVVVGSSAPTVLALVKQPLSTLNCKVLFHLANCPQ